MDAVSFTEKLAESFERFMAEAQLSSAISVVIDDGVLSDVTIKPSFIQRGLMMFIKDLQHLHDTCDPVLGEEDEKTKCWSCRQEKQGKVVVDIDPSVIQITADNKEIDKRIRAFIERKQVEKDDTNRREFCVTTVTPSSETTCARTDAVFASKMGGKSHVKVSKVVNKYGPQTRPALVTVPVIRPGAKRSRTPPDSSSSTLYSVPGVEERLHNMESYLKMKSDQTSSTDVFQRLKTLEDRILHLESISPEYSHISSFMSKHQRGDSGGKAPGGDTMVQDIDNRIMELQRSLRMKKARMEMESSAQKKMET